MSSAYAMDVFGISASLLAGIAFLWALYRRYLRTEDRAMYETIKDGEADLSALPDSAAAPSAFARLLYLVAFLVVLTAMVWPVVAMIQGASRLPQAGHAAKAAHAKE